MSQLRSFLTSSFNDFFHFASIAGCEYEFRVGIFRGNFRHYKVWPYRISPPVIRLRLFVMGVSAGGLIHGALICGSDTCESNDRRKTEYRSLFKNKENISNYSSIY